jgi:hypothetical protein
MDERGSVQQEVIQRRPRRSDRRSTRAGCSPDEALRRPEARRADVASHGADCGRRGRPFDVELERERSTISGRLLSARLPDRKNEALLADLSTAAAFGFLLAWLDRSERPPVAKETLDFPSPRESRSRCSTDREDRRARASSRSRSRPSRFLFSPCNGGEEPSRDAASWSFSRRDSRLDSALSRQARVTTSAGIAESGTPGGRECRPRLGATFGRLGAGVVEPGIALLDPCSPRASAGTDPLAGMPSRGSSVVAILDLDSALSRQTCRATTISSDH